MITAGLLKSAYKMLISMNRRRITVAFAESVIDPDTGERVTSNRLVGPFDALVERRSERGAVLSVEMAGLREEGSEYVMLASPDANLPVGDYTDKRATFAIPGLGTFRITDVFPGEAQGELGGYVCQLEQEA